MKNIFDNLAKQVFNTTAQLMGYDAVWIKDAPLLNETARVHFKTPTEKELMYGELRGIVYTPEMTVIEYFDGTFTGLYESVRSGGVEVVNVASQHLNSDEKLQWEVRWVHKIADGNTYLAGLLR